jgi:hypothetical protein
VAEHVARPLAAIAGLAIMFALGACGLSPEPPPESATSIASESPESSPDKTVAPQPVDREVSELTGFISPTGNVACMIDADWARCDIIDRDWSAPPRPADCEFDYGQGISLAPGEQAQFVCAGDTAFGPDEVLPYGESITAGLLRCESADSGITCRDTQSGHGFSISQQAYRLF